MKPVLFHVGQYNIPAYFTFLSLGLCTGLYVFSLYVKRSKLDRNIAVDLGLIITVTAYTGARLFHVIFEMPLYYLENPLEIFAFWKGGYVFYGGFLVPLFFIYLYCRHKKLDFLMITDLMAPASGLGIAVGRIACLLQGCCYGKHSSLPWAIIFHHKTGDNTPLGISLHPTQFYHIVLGLLMFFLLHRLLVRRNTFQGKTTLWAFVIYGSGRFIIEFFRGDFRGTLFDPYMSTSQFISLALVLCSSLILYKKYKYTRNNTKNKC